VDRDAERPGEGGGERSRDRLLMPRPARILWPLLAWFAGCNDWGSLSTTFNSDSACVAFVVAGDTHTCARLADGSVTCWGDNRFGQLGTGDKDRHARAKVSLGLAAAKVFLPAGDGDITADRAVFGCAITNDNVLSCWGDNRSGQLGTGDTETKLIPTRVGGLVGDVAKATNGAGHGCAQMSNGALYCWGGNAAGQLGTGDTQPHPLPVKVDMPVAVDRLSAGASFTCVRGVDNSLWCFGANEHGQLGLGNTTAQTKPMSVAPLSGQVVRVSTGAAHTCVFTADGAVWCWGDNSQGQLGTGDTMPRSSPVKIAAAGSVTQIFAGGSHTCALRVDGSLWCWGSNRFGQLGTGDTNNRLSPVAIAPADLGTSVSAAYAGGAHTCAVKVDLSVWCWGSNQYGQLGVDVGPLQKAPLQVSPPCQ
jgi:alpha-tubulin suppressor-like RCC1 family protein